jgi:acyl transferase domain-containing protein/NADPH:quinone reductase-like Zn-dependent oxidoreductase/acyl carrier protein
MTTEVRDHGAGRPLHEPIAILGIGCRYPTARGADEFWKLMMEGRDAIRPYPGGRFRDLDAEYAQAAAGGEAGPRAMATHLGGFLPDVDRFDAAFFGISPREAAYIDPQQRLLLEASWDALEDAGQVREKYYGSRTGVFAGLWTTDYESHIYRTSEKPEFYQITGGGRSTVCGRLSFTFGFEGPSISVDTACSSSMVAIHLGCQSLQLGECDMALAGGANVVLSTDVTRLFTSAGMLATDGHCKFGDIRANGFVRSEGAGVVILKRLSDAVAAGDSIYAVICGSSVNNDGCSSGYLVTPSRTGQRLMLEEAWRQAGIKGKDLSYIEAHGTGTQVGDPVEIGAISDALRRGGVTDAMGRVPIGSVKTNIGHTESAAGVAGVIKTALILQHGMIPPSLQVETLNPAIDWAGGPVEIATSTRGLGARVEGKPRMAGASSFGLTGTNSHVVMAEFSGASEPVRIEERSSFLLPITAYSAEALRGNAEKWMAYLENQDAMELAEICYAAGARRTHLAHRFAAVGRDAAELRGQLGLFLEGQVSSSPEAGMAGEKPLQVVFIAPGQGSQWDGMARELLLESEAFRESFTACDRAIALETEWSLIERLGAPDAALFLQQIDFVQPALFAMSVALAAVWSAAGVVPDAVIGHSMGEVAAAHLAGVLSLEDAAAVICRRSRLMRRLSGSGAMASVDLPAAELSRWLEPFVGRLSIAAANSPSTTVVAGEADAIEELLEWLELKEVFCRRIKVDVASHSAMVDPILLELAEQLAHLRPQAGMLPFFSTMHAAYTDGAELDATYWVRNLREPVRLAESVSQLVAEGCNCFIELSPHPVLVPAIENTLRSVAGAAEVSMALPSLLRGNPAWRTMLRSLGRFWIAGGNLDWASLAGRGFGPVDRSLSLPNYAFEHERFWEEADEVAGVPVAAVRLSPMLLSRTDPAHEPGTSLFTVIADFESHPFLADHRVGGAVVLPATAHIEIALEAARALAPEKGVRIAELVLKQAVYLSETEPQELQLVARREPGHSEKYRFALMGRTGTGEGGWVEHSTGILELISAEAASASVATSDFHGIAGSKEVHYGKALASGLEYGPAFQLIESYRVGSDAVQARLRVSAEAAGGDFALHPAVLDCCFQGMIPLLPRFGEGAGGDVYLPSMLRSLRVFPLGAGDGLVEEQLLLSTVTLKGADAAAGTMEFEVELRTAAGRLLALAEGMTVQRVESPGGEKMADGLFLMGWKALGALPPISAGAAIGKHWLIFADGVGSESKAAVLARGLGERGGRCTLVWLGDVFRPLGAGERRLDLLGADEYELPLHDPAALDQLLGLVAAEAGRISDVVDLWPLGDDAGMEDWLAAQDRGTKFLPMLVQAITRAGWTNPPRLWLLTEGTQTVPEAACAKRLASAPAWGMGAVLIYEHPELQPTSIDLSGSADAREIDSVVRLILDESKGESARAASREDRFALRGERVYAARMQPCPLKATEPEARGLTAGEEYRVELERAGTLDQLRLRAMAAREPAAGEVAIDVSFVGLNFIDVTKAFGLYFGLDPKAAVEIGGECSGRIVAVGDGVEGLRVGDEVVALTTSPLKEGLLASRVVLPAGLVRLKPAMASEIEAAGLPIAYLTAHYSLNELARMRKGEWVLIHAGAGGVGLAAAKIALAAGAKVIATASSPEKHAFLHEWGVEHVLQSRTLEFAEGAMKITGGRGVDIVLNSLSGDFIPKSIEVLAPYGRFVELGKRDIYDDRRLGLRGFRNNISYFAVDLAAMVEEKREYSIELFHQVMEAIESGRWPVLPVNSFPVTETAEALRYMGQGLHIGKVAIALPPARIAKSELQVMPPKAAAGASLFRRDATYVITGGLGGVGSAVAEWMAANGAGQLVLVSRRAAGAEENALLGRIRALGASVEHRQTDLLDGAAVRGLITEIGATMPPLRGIMHAAAVIDDALVMDLTPERFDAVFGPKIRGTWSLHEATLGVPLDFFMMFSSIAVPFPQLGHGSYSAANSFLDSFAGYRRELGLPATSINWGGWVGMGLAREMGSSRTIEGYDAAGLVSFQREDALAVLGRALVANPQQAVAIRVDAAAVAASYEVIPTLLRELVRKSGSPDGEGDAAASAHPALTELSAAGTYAERLLKLEELLRVETSRVLKLAPERIKSNQQFGQMGIDSLMALEFIRRVNGSLGMALAATAVFNYPTLTQLAVQILKRLGLEAEVPEAAEIAVAQPFWGRETQPGTPVSELSEEDALRALMEPGELSSGN